MGSATASGPEQRVVATRTRARAHVRSVAAVSVALLITACSSGGSTTTTITRPPTTPPTIGTTSSSSSTTTAPSTTVPEAPVRVENLELAATWLTQLNDGVAIGVSERNQELDLNDDGDSEDVIVHVVVEDHVVNTKIEAEWGVEPLDGGGFLMNTQERDVATDLNDDGDTDDSVPQLWSRAGGVTNVGLGAWATPGGGGTLWLEDVGSDTRGELRLWRPDGDVVGTGWVGIAEHWRDDGAVLIGVFEEEQGEDLDGDGRLDDHVLVLRQEDGETTVIGPAYQSGFTSDRGVWRSWNETDADGSIAKWHLGFWHPDRDPIDLVLASVNHTPTSDGGLIFRVSESTDYWSYGGECGADGSDLNDDGDCGDFVLHRWSDELGLVDLGLTEAGWCPECDWGYVTSEDLAFVSQPEWLIDQDLDGDGRVGDGSVLQLVEGSSVSNVGLAVTGDTRGWAVLDEGVVVLVTETYLDRNRDGDIQDQVFAFVSREGVVTNLGIGGRLAQSTVDDRSVLLAEEAGNGRDLNGDGLISDSAYVIQIWREGSGLVNTSITNGLRTDEMEGWRPHRVGTLSDGTLIALVPEQEHGHGDLNGDGDLDDAVAHAITVSS